MYRVARLPMHAIHQSVSLFVECPMDARTKLKWTSCSMMGLVFRLNICGIVLLVESEPNYISVLQKSSREFAPLDEVNGGICFPISIVFVK